MSEQFDKQKSFNNQEKKKTRRTRKDQQGRNFSCPCGKSYLSYPALYTHIKTKHQGKAPKQQQGGSTPKQNIEQQAEIKDPIIQIKQIIDKYFPNSNQQKYPTPLSKQENDYISKITAFWQTNKESKLQDPSNNLNENIDTIFGRFLCQIKSQVKSQGFTYLKQLLCSLRKQLCEQNKDSEFCSTASSFNLISNFNQFLLRPHKAEAQNKRGSPVRNSILTCKVLQNLGAWIFQQRYTNFLVKINSGMN